MRRFEGGTLRVGRGTDNEIVLVDERVSRHHGRFTARHGVLVYTDLDSTNGSLVNGDACPRGRPGGRRRGPPRAGDADHPAASVAPGVGGGVDAFTLVLWVLRIGFVVGLYLFLAVVVRTLWRDLRAAVSAAGPSVGSAHRRRVAPRPSGAGHVDPHRRRDQPGR